MKSDQPAFPIESAINAGDSSSAGLTKREYFATMAMQGIITANHKLGHGELSPMLAHLVISDSIQYADELIKQLEDGRP